MGKISLFLLFLTIISSADNVQAAMNKGTRSIILDTGRGRFIIPGKKPAELKGQGLTFNTNVTVKTQRIEGQEIKIFTAWIRGCGEVELPSRGEEADKLIRNGDRVELRFERAGACRVIDWKKF